MGEKITLSLVQTSQDRGLELKRFVDSFNRQTNIDFKEIQLIFYDQGDNREIFDSLNQQVKFDYIKGNRCSLSKARNLCLPYVKGKFIAFPDDDCWYEPDTLSEALKILKKGEYDGVTGKGMNENGVLTSIFPDKSATLTRERRCGAISYTLFFKFCADVKFDERIGVGSPYNIGAGEETDYLLTLMEQYHYKIWYDEKLIIHHPVFNPSSDETALLNKQYSYSRGAGFLMQKHQFSLKYKIRMFVRPIIGMMVYFIKGDRFNCKKSIRNVKGRWEGYHFKMKE